jgi:hypothetical protein
MTRRVPVLYRWWDADGKLLYIGKSIAVLGRIEQHRRNSKFFEEAASMTMERYPDETSLGLAEIEAIRTERPPYNIAHNRGYDVDYDIDFAAVDREAVEALDRVLAPVIPAIRGATSRALQPQFRERLAALTG